MVMKLNFFKIRDCTVLAKESRYEKCCSWWGKINDSFQIGFIEQKEFSKIM